MNLIFVLSYLTVLAVLVLGVNIYIIRDIRRDIARRKLDSQKPGEQSS